MHLFVEHLTVIDCAYLCPTHGLVGESWVCDVSLIGELDETSMVMDFGRVKKAIKHAIDSWVDHTLLVPALSPNLSMQSSDHQSSIIDFSFTPPLTTLSQQARLRRHEVSEGESRSEREQRDALPIHAVNHATLSHSSPAQALCLLKATHITPDVVKTYLEKRLMEVVPSTVERIEITLRNESTDAPYFHYVHGLKKHDGNCQRIAHGHRSRLRISKNGAYDEPLTRQWADKLNYAYVATREDIARSDETHTHFAYNAPQGRYSLSYPTALCYVIDSDSTIECIAQHLADAIKAEHPASAISVRAYEGVMKGAVGEA